MGGVNPDTFTEQGRFDVSEMLTMDTSAPAIRAIELLLPDMRERKDAILAEARERQSKIDMELAKAIDDAREAGHTWDEIAAALGGSGRQYAYVWRKRLPDPE